MLFCLKIIFLLFFVICGDLPGQNVISSVKYDFEINPIGARTIHCFGLF